MKEIEKNLVILEEYCLINLNLQNAKLSNEYYYNNLVNCVIDAVFSIGINYNTVKNVVHRFCKFNDLKIYRPHSSSFPKVENQFSVNQFLDTYDKYSLEYITNNIYKNKCRTSTTNGILKSEAVFEFAKVLKKFNVNYFQDIYKILNDGQFEKEIKNIKGQKSGLSLVYFFMLCGEDNYIKPDRMIERFVYSCTNRHFSKDELTFIFNRLIKNLNINYKDLTLRALDHEIWKFQRNGE